MGDAPKSIGGKPSGSPLSLPMAVSGVKHASSLVNEHVLFVDWMTTTATSCILFVAYLPRQKLVPEHRQLLRKCIT